MRDDCTICKNLQGGCFVRDKWMRVEDDKVEKDLNS
jgi:hypothetical protein